MNTEAMQSHPMKSETKKPSLLPPNSVWGKVGSKITSHAGRGTPELPTLLGSADGCGGGSHGDFDFCGSGNIRSESDMSSVNDLNNETLGSCEYAGSRSGVSEHGNSPTAQAAGNFIPDGLIFCQIINKVWITRNFRF